MGWTSAAQRSPQPAGGPESCEGCRGWTGVRSGSPSPSVERVIPAIHGTFAGNVSCCTVRPVFERDEPSRVESKAAREVACVVGFRGFSQSTCARTASQSTMKLVRYAAPGPSLTPSLSPRPPAPFLAATTPPPPAAAAVVCHNAPAHLPPSPRDPAGLLHTYTYPAGERK